MKLIGVDVGTTGCKAALYSAEGRLIAQEYREYPLILTGGFLELDPLLVYDSVCACLRGVADKVGSEGAALAISAMGDTFTPFDAAQKPLMNAIVSFDSRADAEAKELEERFGRRAIFSKTGLPSYSMYPGPKILWLNKNRPEIPAKTWKYLCFEEYILLKLGAEPAASHSMLAKYMLYDAEKNRWDEELMAACGVREDQLPKAAVSGSAVGELSQKGAEETGLPPKTRLVAGGFDQSCCAVSCGVLSSGEMLDTTGTNEILFFGIDREKGEGLLDIGMCLSYHHSPVAFGSYAQVLNAGGAFRWCRDAFFSREKGEMQNVYAYITGGMKNRPGKLLFLPFMAGMGTPELMKKTGGFYGLDLLADRFSIAQAILEGVTYETYYNLELLTSLLGNVSPEISAVGGAANSDYWMQLKADVTGKSFVSYPGLEPGACGAAVFAGVGAGVFASVREGAEVFMAAREQKKVYAPDPAAHERYLEGYERYKAFRSAVKSMDF